MMVVMWIIIIIIIIINWLGPVQVLGTCNALSLSTLSFSLSFSRVSRCLFLPPYPPCPCPCIFFFYSYFFPFFIRLIFLYDTHLCKVK